MIRRLALALLALSFASAAAAQVPRPGYGAGGYRSGFQFIGGVGGFPTPGAVVDYDFKGDRYSGPPLTVSRASPAYIDDSAGNWTPVPANTLRRSDKGALIEGAQTNSIRNNSMQGAVAGSPGTLPTNWATGLGQGLALSVVGIGTFRGVDYIDLRVSGTATSAINGAILLSFEGAAAAASGQLWSSSSFLAAVAGTVPANALLMDISERTSANALVTSNQTLVTPGAWARPVQSVTLNGGANTAFAAPGFRLTGIASGQVVDFTLRIGWPQLEQWNTGVTTVGGASSPIRTTGAAATRAADVATATLASGLSAGTMAAVFSQFIAPPNVTTLARLGTASDRIELRTNSTAGQMSAVVGGAGQTPAQTAGGLAPIGPRHAICGAFAAGDLAVSVNGSAPATAAPASMPFAQTALQIGGGSIPLFGYVERLAIWPTRLTNGQLQQYSTIATWGG